MEYKEAKEIILAHQDDPDKHWDLLLKARAVLGEEVDLDKRKKDMRESIDKVIDSLPRLRLWND